VQNVLGIDIPYSTRIGPGMRIFHGQGIVIHNQAIIGSNVTIRHNTTIGSASGDDFDVPTIGDNVDIGAGSIIIGKIK